MKKLLYLLLAVALVGCAKDDLEVSSGSNETLSFIISDDLSTRADTDKTAWVVGDLLAIFVGDTETSKQYKVASVDTTSGKAILTPATSDDGILNNGTYDDTTFTAYYPYEADRTLSDYQAQEDDADVLYSTGTATNGTVTFATFTHENTHVTFNFVAGREYSTEGFDYIDIELRSGSTPLWKHRISDLDGATTASYSLYCPALDDLSGVVLYMVANGALDAYYAVDLGADTTINEWEAGTPYIYNDLLIGSCDILYDDSAYDGDGAYQVYSATGLQALANLVNGTDNDAGAATIGDIEFSTERQSDINIVLMNDIDLSEVCGEDIGSWIPIGRSGDSANLIPYSGTFDGGGYEISGLYIKSDATEQGLFGCTVGATIKNLGVSGSITGTDPAEKLSLFIGGIVGYAEDGSTITNCYNKATLTGLAPALQSGVTIGGIVGETENSAIVKCYNMGEITSSATGDNFSVCLGGVVGNAMLYGGDLEITECYNLGNVTGISNDHADVGGVVGNLSFLSGTGYSSTLTACYNSGNVTGTSKEADAYVGGVAGFVEYYNLGSNASDNSSITSCYSYGSVSSSSNGYFGGVIGRSDSSDSAVYTTISYCYYDKTVESSVSAVGRGTTNISNVSGLETTAMTTDDTLLDYLQTAASTYWQADNGTNNGYPILIWQATN